MQHVGTIPFETPRLICRPFQAEDWNDMLRNWIADPRVQTEYGEPVYTTASQVQALLGEYIKNYQKPDCYRWAIIEKVSRQNIGQIAFCKVYSDCRTAEIEYCIGAAFWGSGYACEALTALIDHTFLCTDFDRLEAYHRSENIRSGRVLQKSMMQITHTVERFVRENHVPHGEVCYCIDKRTHTIDRVRRMELCFDIIRDAMHKDTDAIRKETKLREMLHQLTEYYENGQWLADYQADEQGLLPAGLKRGVLSQDAVYDLLSDIGGNPDIDTSL